MPEPKARRKSYYEGGSEAASAPSLQDEIGMLREAIRNVVTLARSSDSLDEAVKALGALGQAATRLVSLIKAERDLKGGGDELSAVVSQALAEVLKEFGKGKR